MLCGGFAFNSLYAQNPSRTGTDYALFFVVKEFDKWQDFDGISVQQVREIEKELKENYGFRTEFVLNPTRNQVLAKLDEYQQKRFTRMDQLLIYFSMHGHYQEGATGALIPKDGKQKDPYQDSWIYHPLLEGKVNRIPCDHITLALDACYSGTFAGARGKPEALAFKTADDCASKAAIALRYKSRLYLTSGGKERTSIDSQFAEKWLEALRLRNTDGVLSHNDLVGVLEDASPIPRYGEFKGHVKGGNFVFVHKKSCENKTGLKYDLEADKNAWMQARKDDTAIGYSRYLAQFPNGEFKQLAEKKISEKGQENEEDKAWRQAKKTHTIKAYSDFIQKYPNSYFTELAELYRQELRKQNGNDPLPNSNSELPFNLGIKVRELKMEERKRLKTSGIMVESVFPGGILYQKNMDPGYIITKVDSEKVISIPKFIEQMKARLGKEVILEGYYENYSGLWYYSFTAK